MKNQLLKSVFIRLTKKPWRYMQQVCTKKNLKENLYLQQ